MCGIIVPNTQYSINTRAAEQILQLPILLPILPIYCGIGPFRACTNYVLVRSTRFPIILPILLVHFFDIGPIFLDIGNHMFSLRVWFYTHKEDARPIIIRHDLDKNKNDHTNDISDESIFLEELKKLVSGDFRRDQIFQNPQNPFFSPNFPNTSNIIVPILRKMGNIIGQ